MRKTIKEIVVSHNILPPTVLIIREHTYSLRFGNYEIPFGADEAKNIIKAINDNQIT